MLCQIANALNYAMLRKHVGKKCLHSEIFMVPNALTLVPFPSFIVEVVLPHPHIAS